MKITKETDPQKLRNKNNNYLIIDHNNNPSQFIYNKYKTMKTFGQQVIDINKELADILKQYIKSYNLKENNYLFVILEYLWFIEQNNLIAQGIWASEVFVKN